MFDYIDGGAEDEWTLRENSRVFRYYFRKYRRFYVYGILSLVVVDSLEAFPPLLLKSAIDGLTSEICVPLYDAGLRDSRLQQARAAADKAAASSERIREEAVREIVVAQNALETALTAHEASKALEAAARTTYDAAFDAFRHGTGTVTAVTTAATQLLQASDATTDTYNGALAAAATLAFATGSLGSAPATGQ